MWRRPALWQTARWTHIRPMPGQRDLTRHLSSCCLAFRHGLTRLTAQDFTQIALGHAGRTRAEPLSFDAAAILKEW